jgi:hypothetical protein
MPPGFWAMMRSADLAVLHFTGYDDRCAERRAVLAGPGRDVADLCGAAFLGRAYRTGSVTIVQG